MFFGIFGAQPSIAVSAMLGATNVAQMTFVLPTLGLWQTFAFFVDPFWTMIGLVHLGCFVFSILIFTWFCTRRCQDKMKKKCYYSDILKKIQDNLLKQM